MTLAMSLGRYEDMEEWRLHENRCCICDKPVLTAIEGAVMCRKCYLNNEELKYD